MEACLYDADHGFYTASGGSAGRRGDFITSVEVGPLFGAVVARWLDDRWRALGCPDPFDVADVGAGPGTWARTVRAAGGDCVAALRLTLVERSPTARAQHGSELGRSVAGLDEAGGPFHVVVANELLDNLPVRVLERAETSWLEMWVGPDGEELRPARPLPNAVATVLSGIATPGVRVPVALAAGAWVEVATANLAPGGSLLVFDYGADSAELAAAPMTRWLRTFRRHERGGSPLETPGEQDITCEVPFDQLPPPGERRRQHEWLRRWGIDELVDEGRRVWAERAALGDLTALRARSRVREAEALLDPDGLGGFVVAEWRTPPALPSSRPSRRTP